jgi:hypothetical protein
MAPMKRSAVPSKTRAPKQSDVGGKLVMTFHPPLRLIASGGSAKLKPVTLMIRSSSTRVRTSGRAHDTPGEVKVCRMPPKLQIASALSWAAPQVNVAPPEAVQASPEVKSGFSKRAD